MVNGSNQYGDWSTGGLPPHQPRHQRSTPQQPYPPQHYGEPTPGAAPSGWPPDHRWQRPGGWSHNGAWVQRHAPAQQQWGQQWAPVPARKPTISFPLTVMLAVATVAAIVFVGILYFTPSAYEKENYQAPEATKYAPAPVPIPLSKAEAQQWLYSNALYSKSAPQKVNCNLDMWQGPVINAKGLEDHFNQFTGCLMRVWDDTVTDKRAEVTMFRPTVTVYNGELTTGCGTMKAKEPNAFYCGADQQLYFHEALPLADATLQRKGGLDAVMAHEFAHFIQGRTGILGARMYLTHGADKKTQFAASRRSETQADCLAGVWLRANAQATGLSGSDLDAIKKQFYNLGDDQLSGKRDIVGDHGHGSTRTRWLTKGLDTSDLRVCNSWTASDSQVR